MIEISHKDNERRGSFVAREGERQAGLMTYSWAGKNAVIIDHTEVSADFAGQGVGRKLVMASVDWARASGVKITPLCPFACSVFEKTSDIADVLAPGAASRPEL